MAQLKDTLVSGSLRATDTVYTTKLQTGILYAPTSSSGTTYGPGSADNILLSNGSSIYWGTIGDVEVIKLKGINNSGVAAVGSANRPTTANLNYIDTSVRYFLATSEMEQNSKPTMGDSHILHFAWDNKGWNAQMAIGHGTTEATSSPHVQIRKLHSDQNWSNWIYLLDENNYTDYTVTKTGTGASGTWGINVSGTAAKLSPLSSSDNASSTSTWRSVWMSYNDGTTGRPALSSVLQYQTSSDTLKSGHFLAEHITNGKNEFQIKYGSTHDISFMIGNGNKNYGIWDAKGGATGTGQWMIFADENHNVTVNGNATSATKATQDESGNNIKTNYASSLSVSGTTFTLKSKSDASLSTIALTSDNIPNLNASQIAAGTLTVAQGGTGKSSFTTNSLIMSGATTTAALTTRAIWNITAKNDLTWADHKTDIPTINTIAYWNGRYSNSSSNLTYCVKGEFTDAAVRDLTNTLDNTDKIPVSSAVKAYIDDSISAIQDTVQGDYVTIAGNAQQVTGRKTLSNLAGASFKPAEGSELCNISYNQSLGALVFSFAN